MQEGYISTELTTTEIRKAKHKIRNAKHKAKHKMRNAKHKADHKMPRADHKTDKRTDLLGMFPLSGHILKVLILC